MIAVVVVVVVVVSVLVVFDGLGKSSSGMNGRVLVSNQTLDSIPAEQFDAIAITVSTNSSVTGTLYDTLGIAIYTMTPSELSSFSRTDVISGYVWTSGPIKGNSVYHLDVSLAPGAWYLVFNNPSTINTTAIAFYSDLTLNSP